MVNKKLINLDRANQAMPSGPPTHAVQQKTTTQEKLDLVFRLVLSFVSFTTIIHVIMIEKMDGAGKAKLDCSRSPSTLL